jgi:nicotinic acetylcholine receptor alpha-3
MIGVTTAIALVAVKLPSFVVTVIVAVPSATAVTKPLASTVATEVLSDDHVTEGSVAVAGVTMAVNCCVSVGSKITDTGLILTAFTLVSTVTTQVAVLFPSFVVTVIVAVPFATAVTSPLASTVATAVLSDDQVTEGSVAVSGVTVAIKSIVALGFKVTAVGVTLTLVTSVTLVSTVTTQLAVKLPSFVVTVIVAVPSATAVTKPLASTVATEVLFDDHVTVEFVAVAGVTIAVNCDVCVGSNVTAVGFTVTSVTLVITVTSQIAS